MSTYTEKIRLHNAKSCDPVPPLYLHIVVLEKYMDKFTRAKFGVLAVVLMKSRLLKYQEESTGNHNVSEQLNPSTFSVVKFPRRFSSPNSPLRLL
jgi:hypothetical protein